MTKRYGMRRGSGQTAQMSEEDLGRGEVGRWQFVPRLSPSLACGECVGLLSAALTNPLPHVANQALQDSHNPRLRLQAGWSRQRGGQSGRRAGGAEQGGPRGVRLGKGRKCVWLPSPRTAPTLTRPTTLVPAGRRQNYQRRL